MSSTSAFKSLDQFDPTSAVSSEGLQQQASKLSISNHRWKNAAIVGLAACFLSVISFVGLIMGNVSTETVKGDGTDVLQFQSSAQIASNVTVQGNYKTN